MAHTEDPTYIRRYGKKFSHPGAKCHPEHVHRRALMYFTNLDLVPMFCLLGTVKKLTKSKSNLETELCLA